MVHELHHQKTFFRQMRLLPITEEAQREEKVSMNRKSNKDSENYEIRDHKGEGEIIDLVDVAEEYLETLETSLNLSDIEGDDLDDTLDEELLRIDARDSNAHRNREDDKRPVFEEALVELFESGESAAAELLEEESQKEKPLVDPVDPANDTFRALRQPILTKNFKPLSKMIRSIVYLRQRRSSPKTYSWILSW